MPARRGNRGANAEQLGPDTRIIVRIPPYRVVVKENPKRPQTDCFKPHKRTDTGVSADIWCDNNTPENTIDRALMGLPEGHEWGAVSLTVKDVRDVGLDVIPDAQPDNPYHVLIIGGKFTDSRKKKLAKKAAEGWYKMPVPESY